jgi:hypothetical protein
MAADLGDVRSALRCELTSRGYSAARDTVDTGAGLYVWADGDRAAALFEFKVSAEEACRTMYQGSWLPTLPPRFAVLPCREEATVEAHMLLQAGLSTLFYEVVGEEVTFVGLEEALAKMLTHPGV